MSKQDVSAVVEQDSSPVVDTPAPGSAVVESDLESALESPEGDTATVEAVAVESLAADSAAEESTDGTGTTTTGDAAARPARKPTKASALVREGEVAADFLEQLLDIADMDGDIDVDVDGDRAAVAIVDSEEGRVSRRLVGPEGKVLEALQELTRLAVQSATGERSRLMLDVAGHRAERRAALVTIARGVIATVKSTGEKQPMQPMTAFERKVVHDEVFASGLGSESEGAEPHRFVVVLPA
jgi:spoIIIJ-associated protein